MPNIDIADYSFVLNICNIMILIPLTIVQVDIEQIKRAENKKLMNTKILKLISIFSVLIIIVYFVLINTFYKDYQETIYMFIVILLAKFFQAQSVYYGAVILIFKKYNINLIINVFCLLLNIVLSYLFFKYFNVLGVAVASFLSLVIRYLALRHFSSSISK
jgi:O-antigen/teichoic acid export membrane protein